MDSIIALSAGTDHVLVVRTNDEAPVIRGHPRNVFPPQGSTTNFSVTASSSTNLTYQWQRLVGTNWTNLSGATNTTLSFTNVQDSANGIYSAQVSTPLRSIHSRTALLEVLHAPIITGQSPELELHRAQFSMELLSVQITNQGARFLRYEWFKNGEPASLAMGSAYGLFFSTTNVEGDYHMIVSNAAGSDTSAVWHASVTLRGEATLWGDNTYGHLNRPSRHETNLVAISAGAFHTLGLRENGTVVAWGDNTGGQTNVPTGLTNVTAVAGGALHSLALLEDGTVRAWGQGASGQTNVPSGLTNVTAIAAAGGQSLALRRDGTLAAWGWTAVPSGVSNVASISAGWLHALAVLSNGTVQAWQQTGYAYFTPPAGLTNVVVTASGAFHALALKKDGTVVGWGLDAHGETNPPVGLNNVMRIAAGEEFSLAMKNDGTVVSWGRNEAGQTNVPSGLTNICAISAGSEFSVALAYNEALEYPVNVAEDLLLICNTNVESVFVKDYYLAHRPMVSQANVLQIGYAPQETISFVDFTNAIQTPVLNWLTENPTKKPKYWVVFLDVPSRTHWTTNVAYVYDANYANSVSFELSVLPGARGPFITHINMDGTNACRAYIDKLAYFGSTYSPGKLIISARAGGYGNTNWYFDDVREAFHEGVGPIVAQVSNGVATWGVSPTSIVYSNGVDPDGGTDPSKHILAGTNVAGYMSWGFHSSLGPTYSIVTTNNTNIVRFTGNSGWFLIETIESNNGYRGDVGQGSFMHWFSEGAFGGTNFSNTPVGAVTHTDEPGRPFINNPAVYFSFWARGKRFGACAWDSCRTPYFQAVGDPLIKH